MARRAAAPCFSPACRSRSVMPVDDARFLEAISAAVPSGWRIERPRNGPWIGVRRRATRIPAQGWKLHVSATVGSAAEVLERSLPPIVAEEVPFKLAASPEVLAALNEGEGGLEQAGKFLTVYPADDEQAVRLAVALDEATRGLRGPRVLTDRALRAGEPRALPVRSFPRRSAGPRSLCAQVRSVRRRRRGRDRGRSGPSAGGTCSCPPSIGRSRARCIWLRTSGRGEPVS